MGAEQASCGQPWEAAQKLSRAETLLADESPGVVKVTGEHPGALLKFRHCILNRALQVGSEKEQKFC